MPGEAAQGERTPAKLVRSLESRREVAKSKRGSEALGLALVLAAWPAGWTPHPHSHCVHHGKAGLHSTRQFRGARAPPPCGTPVEPRSESQEGLSLPVGSKARGRVGAEEACPRALSSWGRVSFRGLGGPSPDQTRPTTLGWAVCFILSPESNADPARTHSQAQGNAPLRAQAPVAQSGRHVKLTTLGADGADGLR